jgi:MFS family permease
VLDIVLLGQGGLYHFKDAIRSLCHPDDRRSGENDQIQGTGFDIAAPCTIIDTNVMKESPPKKGTLRTLPRNVWAVSLTSFFMDISSEMVINVLPLVLVTLGMSKTAIGVIESIAEGGASLLKVFSGWLSDKLRARKWLAVAGYGLSTLAKPFFYFANTWGAVAGARWGDRVGKGVRTAPRDALVADSIDEKHRGLAFGFHRAADTGGAFLGLLVTLAVIWLTQKGAAELNMSTFQTIVLISLIPATLAVLSLAIGAKEVSVTKVRERPRFALKGLGKRFTLLMMMCGLFELGNSSDSFLVMRARDAGLSTIGVIVGLLLFNLIYTLVSTPAGSLSDRIGRRRVIVGGWIFYAIVYAGFGLARTNWQIWVLYGLYGLYYATAYGTTRALVADIVPPELRGTAYGTYSLVIGLLDLGASIIAGALWDWMGAPAPFLFGSSMALMAAMLMITLDGKSAKQQISK